MKKWLGLAMALLLLVGVSASAEGFTLRNEIAFGDTMEEVLEKETFEIAEIDDGSDEEESADSEDESDEEESETSLPYSIRTKNSSLAGIDDSYILI